MEWIILGIVLVLVLFTLVRCIRIVQQAKAYVVERLGAYKTTWNVGLHFKMPFIERVAKVVTLKEQVADFPPQPVITKDNVTMQIDTVLYFQITDPKLYAYGVERPMSAIENLSVTTMRNIIGDMDLEQTLTSRDTINSQMRALLDEATDPWGIKVNRVEVKNIQPPPDIQSAMEKQMKAEREKREALALGPEHRLALPPRPCSTRWSPTSPSPPLKANKAANKAEAAREGGLRFAYLHQVIPASVRSGATGRSRAA